MSRIHDALKRAEQERATSLGTHVEPSFEQPVAEQMPMPPMHSPVSFGNADGFGSSTTRHCWRGARRSPGTRIRPPCSSSRTTRTRLGAEEFRTLRSRLYQIREKMPLKRLLVTSALPKEGKSFVAANLAQVLVRQHGRRALIVDADLRNPGLHRHLGTSGSAGTLRISDGRMR